MEGSANFGAATRRAAPKAIFHVRIYFSMRLGTAVERPAGRKPTACHPRGDLTMRRLGHFWLQRIIPDRHRASVCALLDMKLKTPRFWLHNRYMTGFAIPPDTAIGLRSYYRWYRTVMRSRVPNIRAFTRTL